MRRSQQPTRFPNGEGVFGPGALEDRAHCDFFNLFNANSILSINTSYNTTTAGNAGASRNVTGFLPGCLIKIGVHVDF